MREGSYAEIRKGMRVVGQDGETLGGVQEVLVDEGSGIFVGLAVRPNLFAHALRVPGELVERLHDGVVHVNAVQADLQPYETPDVRYHEAEDTFASTNSKRVRCSRWTRGEAGPAIRSTPVRASTESFARARQPKPPHSGKQAIMRQG